MKIRLLGFNFETGNGISNSDFYKLLLDCNEGDFKFANKNRIIYFSESGNDKYYLGLFITIKDHKKFLELRNVKGAGKKIVVSEVGENSDLMEFNFFIINKTTLMGLYQSYHHSCSINQFGIFCRERYETMRDERITAEKAPYEKLRDKESEKVKKAINKKYKGTLKWRILVRQEALKALINHFESLSSFEFDTFDLTVDERQFIPAAEFARKVHTKVSFVKDSPVKKMAKNITDFISDKDISAGVVRGYDSNGVERALKIMENPDVLGEYDFDSVISKHDVFDLQDLSKNWMIKELLLKAKEYAHIFETPNK